MKRYLIFLLVLFVGHTAIEAQTVKPEQRNHVGDIPFDPKQDDPLFSVADEDNVLPYNTRYGMLIKGERNRVLNYFKENYKVTPQQGQSGYITIRFLVNSKGETGRFRVEEMDYDYQPFQFSKTITSTLLQLTKSLDGWITEPGKRLVHTGGLPVEGNRKQEKVYEYYQYLLFKLNDGVIETILP